MATLGWVDWFNNKRLLGPIGSSSLRQKMQLRPRPQTATGPARAKMVQRQLD
jgi:hypothetical protein